MSNKYNVYCCSRKESAKSKCGDAYGYKIINIEDKNNKIIVMVVSDGVSTCKNDNIASNATCETFLNEFISSTGSIKDRISFSIKKTNEEVVSLSEIPGEYRATLLVAVWEEGINKLYYTGIGDSRIFKLSEKGFVLLTEDDKESVPLMNFGKPIVRNGMPVFAQAITNYIGKITDLDFKVEDVEFLESESIIMATDGIHNNGNLPIEMKDIIESYDPNNEIKGFVLECVERNEDDATVLILRRNDIFAGNIERIKEVIMNMDNYKNKNIFAHNIINFSQSTLVELIFKGDSSKNDYIENILDYLNEYKLNLPKNELIKLFDKYLSKLNPDKVIYDLFHSLISKSI
jgi:serine/threonine protein phosphatase PrpC